MKKRSEGVSIHFATPECDKLLAVSADSQKIGAFLEWLEQERELTICDLDYRREDRYYPAYIPINKLLAEYFKIDLNKVEQERSALLDGIRASHATGGK